MAIAYKSQGAGASTETSGAALSPLCPAVVDANDILIAHVFWEGTASAPNTPGGWTLLHGPAVIETSVARHWVFGKIAAGTEDGAAVAFGNPAVTTQRAARVYSFSGYVGGSITDLVRGFAETSHATDPQMPTVTTTQAGALAVALVAQNDNNTTGNATGESGGDWTEAVAEYSVALTPGFTIQIQTATPTADPGTISGGSVSTQNDPCGVIGFEIRAAGVYTATVGPTIGKAACAVSATFSPGTHTATSAPAVGHVSAAAAATFLASSFNATVAPSIGHVATAASATFSPGTHTAAVAPSVGAVSVSITATFSPGTHTATVAPSIGHVSTTVAATFSPGVHTAIAAWVVGNVVSAVTATFVVPQFSATVGATVGTIVFDSAATFSLLSYHADVAVSIGAIVASLAATFSPGTHTATVAPLIGHVSTAASATFSPPVYSASSTTIIGRTALSAMAVFTAPVYSATAAVSAGGAAAEADATFLLVYSATASVLSGAVAFSSVAQFASPVYTAVASVVGGRAVVTATASHTAPSFVAEVAVSSGPTAFASIARLDPAKPIAPRPNAWIYSDRDRFVELPQSKVSFS